MNSVFTAEENLYKPISTVSPAGEAVEDYHFSNLDLLAAWPEREIGGPDPTQKPSFLKLKAQALGFLENRTRDIRPLGRLALAETGLSGCEGLARAMDLSAHWLTEYWNEIHPQDLDKDEEFTERMLLLSGQYPINHFALALDDAPLFTIPGFGDASLRTLRIAKDDVAARENDVTLPLESIRQVIIQHPESAEALKKAAQALNHVKQRIADLDSFLEGKPDVYRVDGFRRSVLASLQTLCDEALVLITFFSEPHSSEDTGVESGELSKTELPDSTPSNGADTAITAAKLKPVASPTTRNDAIYLMDEIIRYYARNARSSPIPIALIALRDLMDADFNIWINKTARRGMEGAALQLSEVEAGRLSEFLNDQNTSYDSDTSRLDLRDVKQALSNLENEISKIEENALAEPFAALSAEIEALQPEMIEQSSETKPRIQDREGVKHALDVTAGFFAQQEPSSPAPAYLRQLKALVDASFRDIVNIIIEDGEDPKLPLK